MKATCLPDRRTVWLTLALMALTAVAPSLARLLVRERPDPMVWGVFCGQGIAPPALASVLDPPPLPAPRPHTMGEPDCPLCLIDPAPPTPGLVATPPLSDAVARRARGAEEPRWQGPRAAWWSRAPPLRA